MALLEKSMSEISSHFYQNSCIGGISEIFDALVPIQGKGCVHQAWSVGMLLKAGIDAGLHH